MRNLGGPLVACVVAFVACTTVAPLSERTVTFNTIAGAGGRTIAGSDDGRVYDRNENKTWFPALYLSPRPIDAVYYRDGRTKIAVGGPYFARISGPGDWTGAVATTTTTLAAAGACRDAQYVVGNGGYAASFGGSTWLPVQGIDQSADLVDLACGRATVLFASYKQTSGHFLSSDGKTFTKVTSPPADTCSVDHAGSLYYDLTVDGRVFTSPDDDAKTWTEIGRIPWKKPVPYCTLVHGGDTFCASGEDLIACSGDGKTWTEIPIAAAERKPVNDIALQEDGALVAVGPDGWILDTQCSFGVCQEPKISQVKIPDSITLDTPLFGGGSGGSSSGGGSSGTSGGSCDGCTRDSDCSGVATRNGIAGAACEKGLCYPCFESCSAGSTNCRCVTCADGCGSDATCTGGTLCAFQRAGKKPCE